MEGTGTPTPQLPAAKKESNLLKAETDLVELELKGD